MDKRSLLFISLLTLSFFLINYFFPSRKLPDPSITKPVPQQVEQQALPRSAQTEGEELYILENDSIQLVFSTAGGGVAEINLPMKTKNNNSAILPIGFDKEIATSSPKNELFPLRSAYKFENGQKTRVSPSSPGLYYPLLRRPLLNNYGEIASPVNSAYYAFNIKGNDIDEKSVRYKVESYSADRIVFSGEKSGRKITKTYSLNDLDSPYCFTITVKREGKDGSLFLYSGIPDAELISNSYSPELKISAPKKNSFTVEKVKLPKSMSENQKALSNWLCNSNGYFGIILSPQLQNVEGYNTYRVNGDLVKTRLALIDPEHSPYPADKYPGYSFSIPLSETDMVSTFHVFAGPLQKTALKKADSAILELTGQNPHFSAAQSYHGFFSFISEPFAKLLLVLMQFFHMITRSWGFSIILLTIVLRLMLYPLNAWSIRSNLKMQEISPKVKKLQEKYKDDKQRQQVETMNLYRENGVNPLTGGCFPILIQMPFLIGMYDLLKTTFILRGASFLVPAWIPDLTAPDILFSWSYPIPFIGRELHLLPILLGGIMFIQQRFSSTLPKDSKLMTEEQRKQVATGNIMAIFFTFLFYKFPSGLNLYWLSSSALAILQQYFMTKRKEKKHAGME